MTKLTHLIAALLALGLALSAPLHANPYEASADVKLLRGWVQPDGTRIAALEVTLKPGWKTYWRAPGDAGVPPHFNWTGSRNLHSVGLRWPQPVIFHQAGMRTIGYHDKLVLPLVMTPKDTGKPITLDGTVDLGICKDICIPIQVRLKQVLPTENSYNRKLISAALARAPRSAAQAKVRGITCDLRKGSKGLMLSVSMQVTPLGGTENAVIETGDPLVWATEPKLVRKGQSLRIETELVHALGGAFAVNRSNLRFTLLGQSRAVDIQGCG